MVGYKQISLYLISGPAMPSDQGPVESCVLSQTGPAPDAGFNSTPMESFAVTSL